MRKWIYFMINSEHTFINFGYSDDILKVIKFYNSMPQIVSGRKNNYLVYCEAYQDVNAQVERFNELSKMTINERMEIVKATNPTFIEFTEHMILNQ